MNQQTFSLSAKKRESNRHSARETRDESRVPAVVYGPESEPISISLDNSDILRTYREAGKSALIDLDIDGKNVKVLMHEISLHPVKNTIYHVDFYAVNLKNKTNVDVPLHFVGESNAIKNLGALFMKENEIVEIKCLPSEIPSGIDVDISQLENIGDQIMIKDLDLDREKYEILTDEEALICSAVAPKEEVLEDTAPAGLGEENEEGEGENKKDGDKEEESKEEKSE
ncbi:50S ribosomal protein L25 [Candidatus Gracilibacteria bacterium]|nr:50S ribosomal protein L25 [Candidatus Gracilibacteria bacterium]